MSTVLARRRGRNPHAHRDRPAAVDRYLNLIHDYRDRVRALHVKDFRAAVAERGKAEGWDCRKTVLAGLWAGPGHVRHAGRTARGLRRPADHRGRPRRPATPEDIVRLCGEWARDRR
ncbi:hypothetical protein GCM10017786_14290 [Amycolatopsis deserti]|uniref:Integrase n=1 Tax=Amycolatopsis deserti TaxID=185696 RepID=A0ABQ3IGV9_9PSEU|nr:hypothetical protein GCM10017786_14290 [Amycolatopsis deserti]